MGLDIHLKHEIYHDGITHNMNKMAKACGMYERLWRADENGVVKAKQLIATLVNGIAYMEEHKEELKAKYTPENNWGSYEGLLRFCRNLLRACVDNPETDVEVSR